MLLTWVMSHSGPWKQLLDISQELTFSVEAEEAQRSAFRRASTSVRAVVERIRANRAGQFGASLAVSGSLAGGASIGGFASQLPSLSSSSQHSLGDWPSFLSSLLRTLLLICPSLHLLWCQSGCQWQPGWRGKHWGLCQPTALPIIFTALPW